MMIRIQKELDCFGSKALITIVQKRDNAQVHRIIEKIIVMIEEFENHFSRFKKDSELTQFNINAGKRVKVSEEFKNLLENCVKLSRETDSAFNPFILPSLQKAGYDKSWVNPTIESDEFEDSDVVNIDQLTIGEDWAEIPINTAIDLGGIGKGYMLDKISKFLNGNIENYWISLGGDLICRGKDINGQPWNIAVADAIDDRNVIDSFESSQNKVTAIATSSTFKRRGFKNNKSWNHIINPATLEPIKSKILSATVVSSSGVTSDVMAKSIIINGQDFAERIKASGTISAYLLQNNDKTIRIEK